MLKKINKGLSLIIGLCFIIGTAAIITYIVYINNSYPLGNDVYGHLYKIKTLYEEINKGNWYPIYTPNWYSGIELFRYWPPASYYFYCIFMFITKGDIYHSFLLFLFFVILIGNSGWLLFGWRENKIGLCTLLGIFYFLLPDNLRVFFSEGNIPRIFITMLLPYIFFFMCEFLYYKKKAALICLAPLIVLLVSSHIMISAMFGLSAFIYLLIYAILEKQYKHSFILLVDLILGYITAGIVLIPGLIGGIVTQNSVASQETSSAMWSQKAVESLNPILRLENFDLFYFGLSLFIIMLLGLLALHKRTAPGFLTCLIIFVGTTFIVLPILSVLPMSQVFWMIRFIPMACVMFFIALLYWDELRKISLTLFLLLIFLDGFVSFSYVLHSRPTVEQAEQTIEQKYLLDKACKLTDNRLAIMDLSNIGSYPSYYIKQDKDIKYLFGWAYQGAYNIKEIVDLNEAFDNGYYTYVFDRLLQYGCDTVVVKKDMITDITYIPDLLTAARNNDYNLVDENEYTYLFDYTKAKGTFGVIPQYENVCIGVGSEYLCYLYPSFYKLTNDYLDDYTYEDLCKYKKIYLSGPNYHNKAYCENLILQLAKSGVKIYVDMHNLQNERSVGRNSFLGVVAQPITFTETFPVLEMKNGKQFKLGNISERYTEWRTVYFTNLHNVTRKSEYQPNRYLDYLGTTLNNNITFIGLNLVYYCAADHVQSEQLYKFLDEVFEVGRNEVPKPVVVPLNIVYDTNSISIHSDYDNVNTTLSNLDSFIIDRDVRNTTLLHVNSGDTNIKIVYMYFKDGLICSILGITLYIIYFVIVWNLSMYKTKGVRQ